MVDGYKVEKKRTQIQGGQIQGVEERRTRNQNQQTNQESDTKESKPERRTKNQQPTKSQILREGRLTRCAPKPPPRRYARSKTPTRKPFTEPATRHPEQHTGPPVNPRSPHTRGTTPPAPAHHPPTVNRSSGRRLPSSPVTQRLVTSKRQPRPPTRFPSRSHPGTIRRHGPRGAHVQSRSGKTGRTGSAPGHDGGTRCDMKQPPPTGSLPAPTVHPAADQLHDQRPMAVGPRLDARHLSDFPADSDADPDPG